MGLDRELSIFLIIAGIVVALGLIGIFTFPEIAENIDISDQRCLSEEGFVWNEVEQECINPGFSGEAKYQVSDFETCAEAGYAIGESHPRQCWTPGGRHFVEGIATEGLLRACPDEWIRNEMPCICADDDPECEGCKDREYFITNGERGELEDFDVSWIEKNCELEKQIVY